MPELNFKKKVLCIGAGYVGGPTMTVIANHCPDYKIHVVDISEERIGRWNSDNLPIFEPGLEERVFKVRGKNLFFSTDIEGGIEEADIIFVAVNTPTKTFGEGIGRAADLQFIEQTARKIREASKSNKIVIEKSTIPVRAAETLGKILHSGKGGPRFEILSNPEFMAEGTGIQDMESPDRILIGSMETPEGQAARDELIKIYEHWVPRERIITTNLWSSELSKLVANAFLAQRITSINSISAVCEMTEADVSQVSDAVGRDSRVGPKFLKAGVGFGGSCFRKDILNLVYLCEHYGLDEIGQFWNYVVKLNDFQMDRFVKRILKAMFNTLVDKKIAIFGFAFKPDTGDTRDAPAIFICKRLLEERAHLAITDPHAIENAKLDMEGCNNIEFMEDPYKAAEGAHAIALLTEWKEFRDLDFQRLFDSMEKPAYLFDGRNHLDHDKLFDIGFNVYSVGKPDRDHF
ncbi:MAG: nucleotide sugar dehydrogenase [Candidatus Nitronauta litoralis]|uniref:UDP-glucose 6-dehydrogenase n=1 Tax=Candidatus Nitronauta litoralis TaxID=2705533 RepID=A0A7T0BZQ7_9BACT|nr:MAG: nucleotide sugar dehydrogenase [Candidatus Nitronauta litoralis]